MNRLLTIVLVFLAAAASAEEPLELRDATSRALAQGTLWQAARAQGTEANAATRLAGDAFHPQVLLATTPGYASGLSVAIAGRLPAIATLEAQETFYDPMRRSDLLSARAREATARGSLKEARSHVVSTVVQAYAKVWLDLELLRSAAAREDAQATLVSEAEALFDEGRTLDIELERARLGLARARQQRLDVESDRDLDAIDLAHLMGEEGPHSLLPEDLLQALPEPARDGSLAEALRSDPQMQSYGPALEAIDGARRERERRFQPVIQAQAQYSRLYRTTSYDEFYRTFKADDWSVGVSIAIPVFSGGRTSDGALLARANYEKLRSEGRQRQLDLDLGVRRALDNAGRARARASLARRAESLSGEELAIAKRLLAEGRNGPRDVAASLIALSDAGDELARAVEGEFLARAELLALRGELLPALGIPGP